MTRSSTDEWPDDIDTNPAIPSRVKPSGPFQLSASGGIVGPIAIPTNEAGIAMLDVDLLNRLWKLAGEYEVGFKKDTGLTAKERIANAKADLADDLGLDPDQFK